MKVKVLVLCEERREYVSGKGVVVKQRSLEVHDSDQHNGKRVASSMSYVLSDEEKSIHPVDSLNGKVIEIGVERVDAHNGKVRLQGALPLPEPLAKKAA